MTRKIPDIRRHAKKRAAERMGTAFSSKVERQLVVSIEKGNAKYIRTTSRNRHIYNVPMGSRIIRVVYSPVAHQIVTILGTKKKKG